MNCLGGCGTMRAPGAKWKDDRWVRGHCPRCYEKYVLVRASTEAVRRYRSDAENAERDRERSRRWKEQNRDRKRAYDRAYDRERRQRKAAA